MRSISDDIRHKAKELGFHKVGFAKVVPLSGEGEKFRNWLSHGYQGTMAWLEKNPENRIDPRKILPDAKSVISVAMNYYNKNSYSNDLSKGKISRYALGGDYHVVLKTRLNCLMDYIKEIDPLARGKVFVDSGDIMEKTWVVRAGIGWRGKHSITVTKEFGSWVFLGEIILNLELEYDPPAADLCGDCHKCIDACPTKAIYENENGLIVIDHELCIGCRYCEWVCPYGAPQFDTDLNMMTKCNLCEDYIITGKMPSCVDACPMRALDFGPYNEMTEKYGKTAQVFPLPDPAQTEPGLIVKPHKDAIRVSSESAEVITREDL